MGLGMNGGTLFFFLTNLIIRVVQAISGKTLRESKLVLNLL